MSLRVRTSRATSRPPAQGHSIGARRVERLALASIFVLVVAVTALHVHAYQRLSPIDELHHVDYMLKAADGQLLRRGDVIGPETRREGACRGVDAPGFPAGDCSDESWLDGREFNTEEIQPPAYYFLTGWTARVLRPLLGTSSTVAAGRMVGALWAGAGAATVWAALSLLGSSVLVRWSVAALVVTTPVVLHASTTVTNDATGLLAGGAMLLAVLAWERGRVPGFVVLLVTVAGVSLRLTNFVGAGVIVLYLVLRSFRKQEDQDGVDERSSRSQLLMAAGIGAAVVVAGVAWVALNAAVARVGPLANPNTFNQQVDTITLEMVLPQLGATVTPVHDPYRAPFLRHESIGAVVQLTDWLLLGAAIGLAALARRGSRGESLGASTLACSVATGPLLTITNYVFQGAFYTIPARYGLSLVPAFAVVLGVIQEKPWTRALTAAVAGASIVLTLVALIP